MKTGDHLKQALSSGSFPPALLILAPDLLRKERALSLLLEKHLGCSSPSLSFRGDELSQEKLRALEDELYSLSLFASKKVVVIREIEKARAAELTLLVDIVKKLAIKKPDGVVLVILGLELPKGGALYKQFAALEADFQLSELVGGDLKKWALRELSRNGVSEVESAVPDFLIALTGGDLDDLTSKVEHLALYSESGKTSIRDCKALFQAKSVDDEFELLSFIAQGDKNRAQSRITALLRQDKSPFLLLGLIARTISQLVALRTLLDRGSDPDSIATLLKVSPWIIKKQILLVRRYSLASLQRALGALVTADSKLKNRSLGAETVMSELVDNLVPS